MITIKQHDLLVLRPSRARIGIKSKPLECVEEEGTTYTDLRTPTFHPVIHLDCTALWS